MGGLFNSSLISSFQRCLLVCVQFIVLADKHLTDDLEGIESVSTFLYGGLVIHILSDKKVLRTSDARHITMDW